MPAVATLEDLKAAQKDLCYSMRVSSSEALLKRSAPQTECSLSVTVISFHALVGGKSRAIQRLGGGDIPVLSEWSSLPGQIMAGGKNPRTIKR